MPHTNITIQAVAGVIIFALVSAVVSDSQMADDLTEQFNDQYQSFQRRL